MRKLNNENLNAIASDLWAIRHSRGEEETLAVVDAVIISREVEIAIDYEASGGFNPSHTARRTDLRVALGELVKHRERIIEEEIPDRDSWTDGFYEIRGLISSILLETDGALRWTIARGIEVEDLVSSAELAAVRADILDEMEAEQARREMEEFIDDIEGGD